MTTLPNCTVSPTARRRVSTSLPPRKFIAVNERTASDYPLSRWYLRPLAGALARGLADTPLRPWHLTLCGLTSAAAAAVMLLAGPRLAGFSAVLVLLAWFFDRADGQLARRQRSASRFGGWLDANVDELIDIGLHTALAAALAGHSGSSWPWALLVAFLAGKYLFMYGLTTEAAARHVDGDDNLAKRDGGLSLPRSAYHLPANADVRVHLLAVALATGFGMVELGLIAGYYNVRWVVRYALVARRMRGGCR